jgi:lipoate-protein ligase A
MVNRKPSSETWRILEISYASPFQNLALEEALAQSTPSEGFIPTVRIWVNPPTAVLGRFQHVDSEVDIEFCERNDIRIARRFTGGGAVYHDEGNLNLTVVTQRPEGISLLEFHRKNASVVQDFLASYGLDSEFVSPNSIQIAGKKISGAAAGFCRHLALWHASTLVSTDTVTLGQVLSPSQRTFETSFTRSRWKPVTTLATTLGRHVDLSEAKETLLRSFRKLNNAKLQPGRLSDAEEQRMRLLLAKYSSREWNRLGVGVKARRKR